MGAPTFVQQNTSTSLTGSTIQQSYTGAQSANNANIATIAWAGTGVSVSGVSDSNGAWTQLRQDTTAALGLATFLRPAIAAASAGANQVTATFAGGTPTAQSLTITEYSGLGLDAYILDANATANGTAGTTATSPSVTSLFPADLVYAAVVTTTAVGSAGSGYTLRANAGTSGVEDKTVATTGSLSASFTITLGNWLTHILCLRADTPSADLTPLGAPFTYVQTTWGGPNGSGDTNMSLFDSGAYVAVGTTSSGVNSYDSYNSNDAGTRTTDYYGYTYPTTQTFTGVTFQQSGQFSSEGGWFTSTPNVQVFSGGTWNTVAGAAWTPTYAGNNGVNFFVYTVTIPPTSGTGIRVQGTPAGTQTFTSCGQMHVYGATGIDVTLSGTATSYVQTTWGGPNGGGDHSLSVISDGQMPPTGTSSVLYSTVEYDTFNSSDAGSRTTDWYGYTWGSSWAFTGVAYQQGGEFSDGGWFTSTPNIQVLVSGTWTNVAGVTWTPTYAGNNGVSFFRYVATFTATSGTGIRVQGTPAGSDTFTSVAELRAYISLTGGAIIGTASPLPYRGPASIGPLRAFVPARAALARQGIAIGTIPTITLTAPLGAALGALGTPNALPWTGPITRGPSRRFVPSLAPLGQQGFASGSVGTITLTAPLGAALGGIGTSLGPPSYGPASFGPIRQFRPGPQSFAAINTSGPVTGSGSIPTITLTAPSGAALGALGTTLEPPSIGPITWGPARRFVPALAALARQGIAIGTIPTITLTAPLGAALGALGTTLEPPSYAPLSQGPRRIFQARPQAFALIGTSGPVTGSGSIGTITLTAPLGAALGELATASPLPFAGPSSVGPRRRFVPALAPLGRAGIASGSIGTITLTAPLGAALGALGTPLAPPERGPSTVGPRRAFVFGPQAFAPITSSGPVTGSGSIGTITMSAPLGAADGYIGTPLALPARGPVTQGPKRAFSSLGQAFAPYVYAAIGVGSIPTLTLSAPTGAALGFQGSVTGAPTRGPRSVGPRRTFSTIGAATAPSAFFGVGPIPTITLTAPTGIATSVPFGINAPGVTCLVVPSISVVCEVVPSISVVCEVVPSISVVCEVVGTASKS